MENQTRKQKLNNILKVSKLDASTRRKVSNDLYKLGDYHQGIPLTEIRDVFEKHGLVLLDIDNTEYSAIFCGREGSAHISFGYKSTTENVNGLPTYIPFDNTNLVLNWYKMTNRYEINMYLG